MDDYAAISPISQKIDACILADNIYTNGCDYTEMTQFQRVPGSVTHLKVFFLLKLVYIPKPVPLQVPESMSNIKFQLNIRINESQFSDVIEP